jgi:hypothetical protein
VLCNNAKGGEAQPFPSALSAIKMEDGIMKDKQGREYARLSELKAGDLVKIAAGFECIAEGTHTVQACEGGFYLTCNEGYHFLEGQLADEETDDSLIGIYPT